MARKIFDEALTKGESYEMLGYLCNSIGHRLSGSPQAAAAVEWSRQVMEKYEFDRVELQEVMVPHWVRGSKEYGKIVNSISMGSKEVPVCALGGSIGTGNAGITARVIEVHNFEQLEELGTKGIEGKFVFFNRPMDPTHIHTGTAYGGAVDQRHKGAAHAANHCCKSFLKIIGASLAESKSINAEKRTTIINWVKTYMETDRFTFTVYFL